MDNERIENAFTDEYKRMKHEGLDALLEQRLDALLYKVYKRGYVRGHADRAREEADNRAASVAVSAHDGVVYIEGRPVGG